MDTPSFTARGPEDILAYIPHAIGFWPRDSLVCLTAESGRIGATLRVDLPNRRLQGDALLEYARAVLGYLEHDLSSDSTFVAVFQEGPVDTLRAERGELMALLAWVLSQAGRPLQELWLVGSDGWNGSACRNSSCFLDGIPGAVSCQSARPHSLDLIRDSRLAAELVYQGSAVRQHPGAGSRGPSPQTRGGVPPQGSRTGRGPALGAPVSGDLDEPALLEALQRWEPVLDGSVTWAGLPDAREREMLGRVLEVPFLRDAVYVSAGSSWLTAFQGGLAAGSVLDDPSAATAEATTAAEDGSGPDGRLRLFGEVMVAESGAGPDWSRMNRFAAALEEIVHDSEKDPPSSVLASLAWVEWCRGRGTHASALLDRALAAEPGHRLAGLLSRVILNGGLSGWASRRHSSWRRTADRR